MKVWITRAQPGADRTAERVGALGYDPLVAPLLTLRRLPDVSVDLEGVSALAFTSANGVEAFMELQPMGRDLPVFAVGSATAQAARRAGFAQVTASDGDVEALARVIAAERPPGLVLHPGARELAGDLSGALRGAGVAARALALYAAQPVPLAPAVTDAWGEIGAVLIHSPRGARAFVDTVGDRRLAGLFAACISRAAAAPLGDRVREVRVAARPDEAALLALLGKPAPAG